MRLGCDAVRIMLHGVCAFCLSQRGAVLVAFLGVARICIRICPAMPLPSLAGETRVEHARSEPPRVS